MKLRNFVLTVLTFAFAANNAHAFFHDEPNVVREEIQSGDLDLRVGKKVKDDRTGAIVFHGWLRNKTSDEMEVSTALAEPLYLNNLDEGEQNLLVTRIYHKARWYLLRGIEPKTFTVPANSTIPVYLFTYCMNYHLDAPDGPFLVEDMPNKPADLPEWVARLMKVVKEHRLEHKGEDIADVVQYLLWYKRDKIKLTQGEKYLEIDPGERKLINQFWREAKK